MCSVFSAETHISSRTKKLKATTNSAALLEEKEKFMLSLKQKEIHPEEENNVIFLKYGVVDILTVQQ